MFNFLAAALMVYLLVNVFRIPGSMEVVSRDFADSAAIPYVHVLLGRIGIEMPTTPLNLAFVWALICCGLVWLYLWRSRGGYELRTVGLSPKAAQYAGISPNRVTVEAMLISGGLAGFLGFNEILGNHHQLVLDFVAGAGFTGIAVALMGRNHPFGIILASVLFGALFQGGGELAFDFSTITRDMVVVMQGLIILFSGALAYMNGRCWRSFGSSIRRAGRRRSSSPRSRRPRRRMRRWPSPKRPRRAPPRRQRPRRKLSRHQPHRHRKRKCWKSSRPRSSPWVPAPSRRPSRARSAGRRNRSASQGRSEVEWFTTVIYLLGATIRVSTPLIFCAMAGLISERSGVIDIGLEGKMLAAAFAAAVVAALTGSAWEGLAAAVVVGAMLSLLHGFACITHRGDQVVSGVAINIIVSGLTVVLGQCLVPPRRRDAAIGCAATLHAGHLPGHRQHQPCPALGLALTSR